MVLSSEKIRCDVLIVGGGTAALVAALEARKTVDNVVVVCKKRAGRSGNTIVSGAAFSVFVPGGNVDDSAEQHLLDMISGGAGINDPELARFLAFDGGDAVMQLEEYGVRFLRSDGTIVRRLAPGHSRARQIPVDSGSYAFENRGLGINVPLLESADRRGVTLLSNQSVHRLLVRDGVACGALAVDTRTGAELAILAPAVVLATGGGGQLFATTNNTADATGDSYALALEAGVTLRDMEFVQFYTGNMSKPVRGTVSGGVFGEGAVLRNAHGERFMPKYDPVAADMATRDVMARAVFHELQAGNGVQGGVYVDLTMIPGSVIATKFPTLEQAFRTHGIDHTKQYIVLSPAAHFFLGGSWIDTSCRTNVQGLFAAGEAAGGVNGANRLAGNALTETAVYGRRAGREAAAHARAVARPPEPVEGHQLPSIRSGALSLAEVKAQLRKTMWDNSGIVRTEAGLRRAQAALQECRQSLPKCAITTPYDVANCLEIERMLLVGLMVTTAAIERTESRGPHYRTDFPDRDDTRWLGSSTIRKDGDELKVGFVPLPR